MLPQLLRPPPQLLPLLLVLLLGLLSLARRHHYLLTLSSPPTHLCFPSEKGRLASRSQDLGLRGGTQNPGPRAIGGKGFRAAKPGSPAFPSIPLRHLARYAGQDVAAENAIRDVASVATRR